MVDTVVLTLRQSMFAVLGPDKFSPSARGLYDKTYRLGGRANMRCVQNPTQRELKSGIYKPRLTLTKRVNRQGNFETTLRIEFSAPKLIFSNNFDELTNNDFSTVIQRLKTVLEEMGVYAYGNSLINAPVSAIHYSKNIPLTDGSIPYTYIKEIQKANITQRLDFNQTDFRNEGQSFKFRANNHEVVFYDKLKELQKAKISERRTEEKDYAIQLDFFEQISIRRPFEVLRMEVRLNQRQKIGHILRKLGLDIEPTFQNLFREEVAKKVLLYYLDYIEANYPKPLYSNPKSYTDFIARFLIDNSNAKIRDPMIALGFSVAVRETSTREVRELLRRYPNTSWYRLIKQIDSFNYPKNTLPVFETIRNSINEFKPLKLVDFQDKVLNNDKYN